MVVNFDDPIPTIIDTNEENKKNVELARTYMVFKMNQNYLILYLIKYLLDHAQILELKI